MYTCIPIWVHIRIGGKREVYIRAYTLYIGPAQGLEAFVICRVRNSSADEWDVRKMSCRARAISRTAALFFFAPRNYKRDFTLGYTCTCVFRRADGTRWVFLAFFFYDELYIYLPYFLAR